MPTRKTTKPTQAETPKSEPQSIPLGEILAFDLETQTRIPRGARDYPDFAKMRYSLAGVQNVRTGEMTIYPETRAGELIQRLSAARLIVGHNIRRFDYAILEHYESHELADVPAIDFMDAWKAAYPNERYVKLDAIARGSLGRGKTGLGVDAPSLWAARKLKELEAYLRDDVQLATDLFSAAEKERALIADVDGRKLRFNVKIPGA